MVWTARPRRGYWLRRFCGCPAPFVKAENFSLPYKFNVVFGILPQCPLLQMKFDINVTLFLPDRYRKQRGCNYTPAPVLITIASLLEAFALNLVMTFIN